MKIFLLTVIAVNYVHSLAIGYPYRSQLLSYSPGRGEFPVQNVVAQGYLRYVDANGAERLVQYNYPQPLYAIRQLAVGSSSATGTTATKATEQPGIATRGYIAEESKDAVRAREQHFREWCEQRYQALKADLDRLIAQGKQPPLDMVAQLQPLEKYLVSNSFEESPEIKQMREEHLRLWNEARLKVLAQEAEQSKLQEQQLNKQTSISNIQPTENPGNNELKTYTSINEQKNALIEETKKLEQARAEHLRKYNEELMRIKKLEEETSKIRPLEQPQGQQVTVAIRSDFTNQESKGQLISETPEVLRAKEEHLRLWNEAKLRAEISSKQDGQDQQQFNVQRPIDKLFEADALKPKFGQINPDNQPTPVQDTPEVIRAREEHLKLFNAVKSQAELENKKETELKSTIKYLETEKLPEIEQIKEQDPELEAERLREADRIREEGRLREIELLREAEREKQEKQLLEAERLRLQQEEERRRETEKQDELKRLKNEQGLSEKLSTLQQADGLAQESLQLSGAMKSGSQLSFIPGVQSPQSPGRSGISSTQVSKDNPFLLRFSLQSSSNLEKSPIRVPTTQYYAVPLAQGYGTNPFLIRYTTDSRGDLINQQVINPIIASGSATGVKTDSGSVLKSDLKPTTLNSLPVYGTAETGDFKVKQSEAAALSELERATKEHFRAHEIALEQLRLANLKNPYNKDCN